MKKVKLLVAMLGMVSSVSQAVAQDTTKTLLHLPKLTHIGFYVAPEYQFGQLKNEFTSFAGVSGMVIFNKTFAIGGTIQRSVNPDYSPAGISPLNLNGRFGGLKMEYTYNPDAAIHFSFPLVVGMGSVRADSANNVGSRLRDMNIDGPRMRGIRPRGISNEYFLIQPSAQVEANLFRLMKLYAGVSYRMSIETYSTNNVALLPSGTLQGLSFNAGLKVGLFDYSVNKKKRQK